MIKNVIKERTIFKLVLFLFLQGACIPSFHSFDYYFAIEILKLGKGLLSLMTLFSLVIALLMPAYSKYFGTKDFKFVFHFN